MTRELLKKYSSVVQRIGLSLVFLWFGISQLSDPSSWTSWLPQWVEILPIQETTVIVLNGIFDTLIGSLLLVGLFTRAASIVGSIHLLMISITLGYNDIGVRDFGLALATLSMALHGKTPVSLDSHIKNKFLSKIL